MKQILLKLTAGIFFILAPGIASADIIETAFHPKIPGPNETIKVSLEGFSIDLDRSTIVWYIDGVPQNSMETGVGRREVTLTTKNIGQKTVVDIAIFTLSGSKFDKQVIIDPIGVDLIWEADTYTPPFYRGKALPTNKSLVSVIAIPQIQESDNSTFIYTWTEDRFNLNKSQSGYKKNILRTLSAESPLQKPIDIEIKTLSGDKKALRRINIPAFEPEIRFYQSNPLLGTNYNHTLKDTLLVNTDEFTIRAEPYFMSNDEFDDQTITYIWKYNRQEIARSNKNILSYSFGKNDNSPLGKIYFEAESAYDWMQNPANSFSIEI